MNRRALKLACSCFLGLTLLLSDPLENLRANDPQKILVIPFQLFIEQDDPELKALSEHMDEQIRASIRSMSGKYRLVNVADGPLLLHEYDVSQAEEQVKKAALNSQAAFLIYGSISSEDSQYRLKAVMWDTVNQRVAVAIDLKVPNIHALPSVFHFFVSGINKRLQGVPNIPFYKADPPGAPTSIHPIRFRTPVGIAKEVGPWRSPEISGALTGIDIGDVDGDKRNETVFVGDAGITINRFESEGLRSLTHFSQSPAVCLSAQAEDLDGDGVVELIVCYQSPSGLVSEIIRYMNRNLTMSERYPDIVLACVPNPNGSRSKLLLGQRTDVEDIFSGKMLHFVMDRGKLVFEETIQLPPGTFLLSYTAGLLGSNGGKPMRAIIDQNRKLLVFDGANHLVSGVDDLVFGVDRKLRVKTAKGIQDIVWPGKLLISDTNNDGQKELLVARNFDGKGEIQAFTLEGSRLEKKWNTPSRDGVISDFTIADFRSNGGKALVFLLLKPDPLLAVAGPRSVVYAYDFVP
ncbi:MAG: hypothetical protein QG577_1182 [Thermodesulfobacteriota bacterium]|nr:hypothetical protein [Thermodesulfobacteriota bacterium]